MTKAPEALEPFIMLSEELASMSLEQLKGLADQVGVPYRGLDQVQLLHRLILAATPVE